MALRGDLPAVMAKTRGVNTPVVAQMVGSGLSILLLLANSSRATANLFTFIILLSTAAVIVVYFAGALAAWKLSPTLGARAIVARRRAVHRLRNLWDRARSRPVVPGAARRRPGDPHRHASPQFARSQPGGGGRSSRASGISRLSFCAKLRRHTSLVPSGPAT